MPLIDLKKIKIIALLALIQGGYASAELTSLSDNDLSEVDGAGIGLVLEDFVFSHGHDTANDKVFRITGLTSSGPTHDPVIINVKQLYIARSSDYGATLNAVNLGRLTNPYEIDLVDGDTIGLTGEAVMQVSAPTKVAAGTGYSCIDPTQGGGSGDCSSRPSSATWVNGERPDLGLEMEVVVGSNAPKNLNIHAASAVFDGSYLRLWGDENANKMAAEFRLNFYTPELEISTCSQANQACGSSVKMRDFQLELALGNTFQPLYLGADAVTGGLTIEIAKITHEYIDNISSSGVSDGSAQGNAAEAFFTNYYDESSSYRSNLSIGDMNISGTSLGSAKVEGLLIQYLDVKFRDLSL